MRIARSVAFSMRSMSLRSRSAQPDGAKIAFSFHRDGNYQIT